MNQSIELALIVVVGWIISVCFHEFAHAFVAYLSGDRSVKSKGYLNFNPFAYTDIRLSVILPTLFILFGGIGLPGASVSIRDDLLRNRFCSSLVSAAGPLATLAFAFGLLLILKTGLLNQTWVFAFCWLFYLEILVFYLNLIPIPGLDGFGIIYPFLPDTIQQKVLPLFKHGITILILLFWVIPGPNELLWFTAAVSVRILGVPLALVDKGHDLYRAGSLPVALTVVIVAGVVYFISEQKNWISKAEKMLAKSQFNECLEFLSKLKLEKDKQKSASQKLRLEAMAYSGLWELDMQNKNESPQNLEQAISKANEACKLAADSFENWLLLGMLFHQSRNLDNALSAYDRALEINPEAELAYINSCKLLFLKENFEALLARSLQFKKHFPYHPEEPLYEGMALVGLAKYEEALPVLEAAAKKTRLKEQAAALKELALAELDKEKSQAEKQV